MPKLTLSISDDLLDRHVTRFRADSRADLEEHLLCLIEAFAMNGELVDPETEKKILEGLESPLVEMNDAAWAAKLVRYDQRHGKRKNMAN
jgi:hypothetical protein